MTSSISTTLRRLATASALAALCAGAFAQAASGVDFPPLADSYLKTGDFIGPDHIRRIAPGMIKDQVRLELGNPHFSEGIFNVSQWDYAFNFRTGKGDEYVTCQYKVKFDKADGAWRVASTHWKTTDCAAYLQPVVAAAPVAAPAPPPARRAVRLGADSLFAFGGAELQPAGRGKLDALVADVARDQAVPVGVTVIGHTDRIGSEASNLRLSQARAGTVRDYLVSKGWDAKSIRATGAGSSSPLVQCVGSRVTPELVACLQPNRRVDVELVADPR